MQICDGKLTLERHNRIKQKIPMLGVGTPRASVKSAHADGHRASQRAARRILRGKNASKTMQRSAKANEQYNEAPRACAVSNASAVHAFAFHADALFLTEGHALRQIFHALAAARFHSQKSAKYPHRPRPRPREATATETKSKTHHNRR